MIASHSALPRLIGRTSLGVAGTIALLTFAAPAFGQAAEAQKPAPNVLLLVDSSGSMEFKTDGSAPSCVPGGTSSKSRWIELVEVLTGRINNYSCWPQDRSSANFLAEFSLGGTPPYDYRYINKYHRALSNNCLYGPGLVSIPASTPYAWPVGAVNTFPLSAGTSTGGGTVNRASPGCAFNQDTDGLLDVYRDMVRFGLMTFDARVGTGTGVVSGVADYGSGFDGNWSYYLGEAVEGHPVNCDPDDPTFQEVGARNAAAPPWEGRMVAFGPPNETNNTTRNDWIQRVLLSTRPYGATPIAGQLDDAREFLWRDTSNDPLNPGQQFGPTNDPNWRASNCRKTILILLTDGEPNLDLRPFCAMEPGPGQTPGHCPYDEPADIVEALYKGTDAPQANMSVETYVVGFALSQALPAGATQPVSCADIDPVADCGNPANATNRPVQACCTLNEIANAGGFEDDGTTPRNARFATSQAELKAIFTDILDDVIQIATRTTPVYSSPGGDAVSKGFKFFSAFDPRPDPTQPQLWEGILERSRFVCSDTGIPKVEFSANDGDDFAANLNSGKGPSRHFYTRIGPDNRRTMRPYLTANTDNIGLDSGTHEDRAATGPADLVGKISPQALGVTAATCPGPAASDAACRDLLVEHLVGINATGPSRCGTGGCSLLGGIYHSVPVTVPGRPSELLRDESYDRFIERMLEVKRPSVLYTSTVDGFLHAFNLAPYPGLADAEDRRIKSDQNNEIWAFIPPAVLPVLEAQYPATQAVLLDGLPIIKDVVATVTGTDASRVVQSYERGQDQARTGTGDWRTVLVQGFGDTSQVQGGYFALDITEPDRNAGDGKPIFRWQLTQTPGGAPLFGRGGTPLITTVFIGDGSGAREVAVAVLPGGGADIAPGAGSTADIGETILETDPADFKTSREVHNYPGAENARSLTIVRLDTGAVLRTFRPNLGPYSNGVVEITEIPAPITGQPKAYPEITGSVADRIYVGDRDGRMWRVDVSSQDPTDWSMAVFYDAFDDGAGAAASQPVILPPVLSVDEVGDVTVAFATGSQELDDTKNRVVSLTETLQTVVGDEDNKKFVTRVNWIHELDQGDRVTGPMVLFNSGLYYAVSHPPQTTGNACDVGSSKVYGVHYTHRKRFAEELANGEAPAHRNGPAPAPGYPEIEIARQPGLVFGVSLEAEPSCFDEEEAVAGNDSFGYGTVMMAKKVTPGKYFLTYGASGNSGDPRGVLEVRQQLPNPNLAVTFDSWAVVYE